VLNSQRKTWSQRQCGVLKSKEFSPCHSEVDVDGYYKRCVHGEGYILVAKNDKLYRNEKYSFIRRYL
jgi:hypothetical protein